ncbi:Uncharacterised protein [Moraxella ovis]|nr:Uncharacterised protein [Moraxella ovis]STZ06908.1 Uncharacterised protein [Moraxella ovis]
MNNKIKEYKSMIFWRNVCVYSPFIVMPTVVYFIQSGFAIMVIFIYFYIMSAILLAKSVCPFCGESFYKSSHGYLFKNSFALFSNHCQHCGEPKGENIEKLNHQ